MALTATVTLGLATAQINQPTAVGVLISNQTGAAVTLVSVTPTIGASGASNAAAPTAGVIGQTPIGPNNQSVIGASGSLLLTTEAFGQAPATYAIGAYVLDSSGTTTVATGVTFITTNPSLPASES